MTGEDLVDITPTQNSFDLNQFQDSLIQNIKKTKKSIVWIYEQRDIELLNENTDNNNNNNNNNNETQTTSIESIKTLKGNWIIISNDGYILTNQHVVEELNSKYTISLNNKEFIADKIRFDKGLDLAVIKIKIKIKITEPIIPAKIANISDEIEIWQIVFALKNDPEANETITKMGIINSKKQKFKINNSNWDSTRNNIYIWLLQNSTAIEPGFSGGPLINMNWEVVWINTAIDNIEYGASYSLPLTQEFINQTISSIKESSKIIRPYIGIEYKQDIDGIRVTEIHKDSPASMAWVEINDVIYSINNNDIDYDNFLYQLYTYKPKKNIILNIQREKFKQDIQINLWIE